MKKLNNKGYMLIEIILASAIATGVGLFITQLTINLKNKNDDMVVRTLVATDQAIILNTIMDHVYAGNFECTNMNIDNKKFSYDDFSNYITKYAVIGNHTCSVSNGVVNVSITITVPQLPDDDFSINIKNGSVL